MLVKKYSFSYYSKASTHIVQYYLQGHRYHYVPIPVSPVPVVRSTVPRTPVHKITPRVVQAWPSASSTTSDTPSFSSSDDSYTDFSSEADESLPRTPPPASASSSFGLPACASVGSIGLEPLNLNSVLSSLSNGHVGGGGNNGVAVTSSNKENHPVIVDASVMNGAGIAGNGQQLVMASEGTRSRKSSLEILQQNIPQALMALDATSMDMCQPSPASREATYIPRAALHSLAPNSGAAN